VTELTEADDDRLADVSVCPTMFQCLVPGIDVRVHVVSGETFACAIEADRLDYRYAARLAMRPIDIDADLRKRIVTMVRAMGLHVAGVDLRHRPDGGWDVPRGQSIASFHLIHRRSSLRRCVTPFQSRRPTADS
jgi:hypothetical protein